MYTVLGPISFVYLRGVWCTFLFYFFSEQSVHSAVSEPALYCLPKSFFYISGRAVSTK